MTLIRVIPAFFGGGSGRRCLPEPGFDFFPIDLGQDLGYVLGGGLRRVGIIYSIG